MDRPSLFLVTDSYWPARGGVEETARALAAHLCAWFRVTVLTHSTRTGARHSSLCSQYLAASAFKPYFDPAGCEVLPLTPSWPGRAALLLLCAWNAPFARRGSASRLFDRLYPVYDIVFRRRLRDLLHDATIVHCFSTGYLARCTAAVCHDAGIPIVQSPFIHFGKWGDSPRQLEAYASSDMVICPTDAFRKKLSRALEESELRSTIVPPVVSEPSATHFAAARPAVAQPFVLFLGRREAHKGLAMLLVGFRGLEHLASLAIAGPGQTLHIRNDFIFDLGEVDDNVKHWLLSRCELLCVPSSDETFGLVYAEAMSHGKPIIALDVAPMREIVENEKTGLLINAQDTDALRVALARLLMDDGLRRRMGRAARERYRELFAGDKVAARIRQVYREVLERRGINDGCGVDVETRIHDTDTEI